MPVPYWRPPYGAFDSGVNSAAAAIGYTKNVMWHVDTIDWKPVSDGGPTANSMSSKVHEHDRPAVRAVDDLLDDLRHGRPAVTLWSPVDGVDVDGNGVVGVVEGLRPEIDVPDLELLARRIYRKQPDLPDVLRIRDIDYPKFL